MLVWLNGPFGVGKTATAHELVRRLDGAVIVDPERVGFGLQHAIPSALRPDFQDLASWRAGVVEVLDHTLSRHPGPVVAPMTVVVAAYLDEIIGGLRARGHDVHHVSLLAEPATLARRLRGRGLLPGLRHEQWALDQLDRCLVALADDRFARHLETTHRSLDEVVEQVAADAGLTLDLGRDGALRGRLRRRVLSLRHLRVG